MKKIITLALCALLAANLLCSCGKPETPPIGGTADSVDNDVSGSEPEDEVVPTEISSSLELLTELWSAFPEEEKFAIAGGDGAMDAPGAIEVSGNGETLDSMYGFPKDSEALIDDAASMIHMMNANTFTCAAYHVVNQDDKAALMTAIKDNIAQRQWMCGFPDRYMVVEVGDYIVSAFGKEEAITSLKNAFTAKYPDSAIIYDEAIE